MSPSTILLPALTSTSRTIRYFGKCPSRTRHKPYRAFFVNDMSREFSNSLIETFVKQSAPDASPRSLLVINVHHLIIFKFSNLKSPILSSR